MARQETLDADWEQLKQVFGLPADLALISDPVLAHRRDRSGEVSLDARATEIIRRHYESDYRLIALCDEVRAKTKFGEGGMIAEKVASGEVEIAIHQYTEILPVQGVTPVGLLPPELQKVTVYTGALTASASPAAASLLDFLASASARPLFISRGFSAP